MSDEPSRFQFSADVNRDAIAASLLVAMILLAALSGAGSVMPMWVAGLAAWLAGGLLWPGIAPAQKRQAMWLAGIGLCAVLAAVLRGGTFQVTALLTQNTALLGMLGAVGFLQLLSRPAVVETLPRGKSALWLTALGAHLLGAVINLSVVFIMADGMRGKNKPTPEQAMILVRAFLAAALWSPFFAATAVALTYAPGANPLQLSVSGMFLGAVLLGLAVCDISKFMGTRTAEFVGFPMQFGALLIPAILACIVAMGHGLLPAWGILSVISVASMVVVGVVLTARAGILASCQQLNQHARNRLPAMSGELVLFLSAGVFAAGLRALIDTGSVWVPFTEFGGLQAAAVLAAMILLAAIGIHAVISITMVATWLAPLHPAPDLLAMVFVMSWAIGLAAGPLSGIHLAMQGRYGISARMLARGNIRYCLQAYVAAVIYLLLIDQWLVQN